MPAALRQHRREDGGDAEGLRALGERDDVGDDRLRLMAVEVGELEGLMVDQEEDALFGREQRI